MTVEEYLEKNEKSQNTFGEEALDDDALNAVAGGIGAVDVDVDFCWRVPVKVDGRDRSMERQHLKTDGSIGGGISF